MATFTSGPCISTNFDEAQSTSHSVTVTESENGFQTYKTQNVQQEMMLSGEASANYATQIVDDVFSSIEKELNVTNITRSSEVITSGTVISSTIMSSDNMHISAGEQDICIDGSIDANISAEKTPINNTLNIGMINQAEIINNDSNVNFNLTQPEYSHNIGENDMPVIVNNINQNNISTDAGKDFKGFEFLPRIDIQQAVKHKHTDESHDGQSDSGSEGSCNSRDASPDPAKHKKKGKHKKVKLAGDLTSKTENGEMEVDVETSIPQVTIGNLEGGVNVEVNKVKRRHRHKHKKQKELVVGQVEEVTEEQRHSILVESAVIDDNIEISDSGSSEDVEIKDEKLKEPKGGKKGSFGKGSWGKGSLGLKGKMPRISLGLKGSKDIKQTELDISGNHDVPELGIQ